VAVLSDWPAVLYMTPESWAPGGRVFVVDEKELSQLVAELRGLGEDWERISEDDATPIYFVRVLADDVALYERGRPALGGGTLYLVRRHLGLGAGWYDWEEVEPEADAAFG